MYLCCGWEGPKALVNLAQDERESLLVKLGVFAKLADGSGIVHSAGLLPDEGAHHVVPPSQAAILPAGKPQRPMISSLADACLAVFEL